MKTYSLPAAARLAGVQAQALRNSVASGQFTPVVQGQVGKGKPHQFSLVQVFALSVGELYRREGAPHGHGAAIARYLATLSQERLEAELAAGRTFPVPSSHIRRAGGGHLQIPGMLIEPPLDDPTLTAEARRLLERLDLGRLWREVVAKVEGGSTGQKRQRTRV